MTFRKSILYFVTEDWYFCSHRLVLAKAAQRQGYDVSVLTRVRQHGDSIRKEGIDLIPLEMIRGGINPFSELKSLYQVWSVYRKVKPDLVHHVALKPVIYGGLVALFMPDLKVVNLIAGLGAIFSSRNWRAVALRPFVVGLFYSLFRRTNTLTIVQNQEDYDLLSGRLKLPEYKLKLIKGSGVDIERFRPVPIENSEIKLALVARMLWDKGIAEYVEAAKLLKQKGLAFEALLVGSPDPENIATIPPAQLQQWEAEGYIKYLGHIGDMAAFWRHTHIAVLPSYREGLPKSLLEAAAAGRPIVTTDTSGCKEIVEDGVNGILVPIGAVTELADAMEKLILDESLRKTMGQEGRRKVEEHFSDAIVLSQTLAAYQELL